MPEKHINLVFAEGEEVPDFLLSYLGDVQPTPPIIDPPDDSGAIYVWGDSIAPRLWSRLQRNGKPPNAGDGLPVQVQCNDIDDPAKPLKLFPSDLLLVFKNRGGDPQIEPETWATEGGHKQFWHVGNFRDEAIYKNRYFKPDVKVTKHPFYVLAKQVVKVVAP